MTALVFLNSIVLLIVVILVVGLLRSHAELLRRSAESTGNVREDLAAHLPKPAIRSSDLRAPDVAGETLDGGSINIGLGNGSDAVIAFLSSGCSSCKEFFASVASPEDVRLPEGGRLIAVTKDRNYESPTKLRELVPKHVSLVMSSGAWDDYGVGDYPYFVYVDASGFIHSEGTGETWEQVLSFIDDAIDDVRVQGRRDRSRTNSKVDRKRKRAVERRLVREDGELARAGIGPGHPSLYSGEADDLTRTSASDL